MASYPTPIYASLFNPNNFNNIYQITDFVSTTASNIFTSVNTFMSDVFINSTLYVNDIQVVNSFLGYNINYFINNNFRIINFLNGHNV